MATTHGGWSGIRFEAPCSAPLSVLFGAWLLGAVALLYPASILALPDVDENDPDGGFCGQDVTVETLLRTTGRYLPGATISILADPPTIRVETPLPHNQRLCAVSSEPVPVGNWSWQILQRPPASTAQLAGVSGTAVTLLLDRVGVYRVRFTACAFGCEVELPDHALFPVGPESREVVVRVLAILPPGDMPTLPPSALTPASPTNVSSHCPWDADFLSAAWRAVEPWNGPNDYKLLEGRVLKSTVAHADNWENHYGMDWIFDVSPDPRHRGLLNGLFRENEVQHQNEVEVEWERMALPERWRPTRDDRVSAWGYWIYDCGHGAKTEIHPPVLLAVHRPRAIGLPQSAGFGTNAFVPGIVTDIWANAEAGNITDDCPSTGLHQPRHPSKPTVSPQGQPISRCLPDSEGYSRNPVNRVFEFNIYLPRSPQAVMAALGRTAPPVPLYVEGCNPFGTGGTEPMCEVTREGDITYLKVRIDLSTYSQPYFRRIIAGWAHAAPDNWGARRWNVLITSLDISDDADSEVRGDGDWRFWVNTNNGTNEWAKLLDCDGCAHGNETFDNTPWTSPSIMLFPNQYIWIATSGFEDDWFRVDSIAPVNLSLGQMPILDGKAIANNGAGKYTMHYQVQPGDEVGGAQLSGAAQARYDAYLLTNNDLISAPLEARAMLNALFDAGFGKPRQSAYRTVAKKQREPLSVEGMSVGELRQKIQRAMREKPAQLNAFFIDLKRVIRRGQGRDRDEDLYQFLTAMKPAVPAALWRQHGLETELRTLSQNRAR